MVVAESHVQIPPDSTGKKLRTILRGDKHEEVHVPMSLDGLTDLTRILRALSQSRMRVINPSFEIEWPVGKPFGWICEGDVEVVTDEKHWGAKSLRLGKSPAGAVLQIFSPPLDITAALALARQRFWYNPKNQYQEVNIRRYYTDGTEQVADLGSSSDGFGLQNINLTQDKYLYALGFAANPDNPTNIYIDDIQIKAPPEVDILDKYARELGTVKQFSIARSINSIDDTVTIQSALVNGDFETGDLMGWITEGNLSYILVKAAAKKTGFYGLEITDTGNRVWQFFYPAVAVDFLQEYSLMVYGLSGTLRITTYYTDGSSEYSDATNLFSWAQLQPTTTAGKFIACISIEVIGGGHPAFWMDTIRILAAAVGMTQTEFETKLNSILDAKMKPWMGWNDAIAFYSSGKVNILNGNDKYWLDSDGPTPATCIPPLKVTRALLGCDHKDMVYYAGFDDCWGGGYTDDWEVTPLSLHTLGGEDLYFKELRYDDVNDIYVVLVKCPIICKDFIEIGLGNYVGTTQQGWCEGDFYRI